MDRSTALQHITETCGPGWLTLVQIAYDNVPEGVAIHEVFQKWGGLKITFKGEDETFRDLTETIYAISQKMCEVCGQSAGLTHIDGWETTLCATHFEAAEGKEKRWWG